MTTPPRPPLALMPEFSEENEKTPTESPFARTVRHEVDSAFARQREFLETLNQDQRDWFDAFEKRLFAALNEKMRMLAEVRVTQELLEARIMRIEERLCLPPLSDTIPAPAGDELPEDT